MMKSSLSNYEILGVISNGKETGETTQIPGPLKLSKKLDGLTSTMEPFSCVSKMFKSISTEFKFADCTITTITLHSRANINLEATRLIDST
jgi:hypothetical protein